MTTKIKYSFLLLLLVGVLQAQITDPKATEVWEPIPPKVTAGIYHAPPSDAIVLFDGKDLSKWRSPKYAYGGSMKDVKEVLAKKLAHLEEGKEAGWEVKDGAMIVVPGSGAIETKQRFGDCQLHIEWLSPYDPGKKDQQYSNSGIFLMSMYEIQVLNSYENQT